MKVLYTGFKGKNNSSCQLLSKITGEKVYLTNSFDGRAVFIHIPSLKNMSKSMMEKLVSCMAEIENVYFCQI